jgi:hypothetical protein
VVARDHPATDDGESELLGHGRLPCGVACVREIVAVGVTKHAITHTFRRAIATHLPEAGSDIRAVFGRPTGSA